MRVFLLIPNLATLGGFESQVAILAIGLQQAGNQVSVFTREPVEAQHPYKLKMVAAGVTLDSPNPLLARFLNLSLDFRQSLERIALFILYPVLGPLAVTHFVVHRGRLGRSWQAVVGWMRGQLGRYIFFDSLTWWFFRRLDRATKNHQPDVIDVHHSYLSIGITYGRTRKLPTVYTEHGAPTESMSVLWADLCPVINQATFIIGRAQASLDGLRRLCQADRPMTTVPQAVSFAPSDSDVANNLPSDQNMVVIVAIGRLSPEKGLDYLLAAFRMLVEEGLPVRLLLAGSGPLQHKLQMEAQHWNLESVVDFLGEFRNEEVGQILARAHIVAHPSLTDSSPMSLLEAMAWGKPIVASRVGGIPELVLNDVEGILVPPGNPSSLAAALKRLVLDGGLRSRLGRAARARFAAGEHTPQQMVAATLAAYKQAIQSHQREQAQHG